MGIFASMREKVFRVIRRPPSNRLSLLSTGEGYQIAEGRSLDLNDVVVSAVTPYALQIGKMGLKHIRGDDEMPDANLRFLLTDSPNELETMQSLMEKSVIELMMEANAYIHIRRDRSGDIEGLFFIKPDGAEMREIGGRIHLDFQFADGTQVTIPYRNIIHLKRPNGNEFFGKSPISSIRQIVNVVDTTDKGITNAIKKSFIVKYLVKINGSARPEDVEAKTKEVEEKFLSDDFGGVVGVDNKTEIEPMKSTTSEVYTPKADVQDRTVKRIRSFYGISEEIINGTYTEEVFNAWHELHVAPIIKKITEEFTRKIFSKRERGHGNRITTDGESLIYASHDTKMGLVALVDRGILSVNEYRNIFGLKPLEKDYFLLRRDTGSLGEVAGGGSVKRDENDNIIEYERATTDDEGSD